MGLNCDAKPAPPRVLVSRWPWKSAPLEGREEREEREEPPRMRSSVVVQGGGSQCLLLTIRLCKKRKSGKGYLLCVAKKEKWGRVCRSGF